MDMNDFFTKVENTLLARFHESGFVQHAGDKGDNREEFLREFLKDHLPRQYGIAKGEIVTKLGEHSHAADIIIYDALNCPILYSGKTAVVPIEGVYGIIEVKSSLSKQEFVDAVPKIEKFKKLAPRDLSVISTREYVTLQRPSRPFGIVLGYRLAENSLDSLCTNWREENARIHNVDFFTNFVCVLGTGLLYFEQANLTRGEKSHILDTDEFVNLVLTIQKRKANNEVMDEIITREVKEEIGQRSFGRFFVYLLMMLARMKLGSVDLGQYIDKDIPHLIRKES